MTLESAETVALRALAHLLGDEAALDRFVALTGTGADEIRAGATDPAFLAGVLDFYLGNEQQLMEMCEAVGLAPELPLRARMQLPGAVRE
ncbi:MAG TPA: DUF3572 domain-containing protein [Alphaproteobacteria bacterium]|jgi:hypothetical protein|nr:DUF3572 domain-containing protein [Alphaproteobacteria bacterium]